MAELIIYRNSTQLTTVHIGENTIYSGQMMGENKVTTTFESPVAIDFAIGDYIQHNGQEYRFNEVPELLKSSRNKFTYTGIFEGPEYTLYNKLLRHLGATEFSYFGTPGTFLQLILSNANEIDPGWVAGEVESIAEGQLLDFSDDSCRSALTKVAEAFKLECAFEGKAVHLKRSVGSLLADITLQYGKGNGLYTLTRKTAADSMVYTRVFGKGGSTNLPANYRNGLRYLSFEDEYVERNVDIYGVIEGVASFPDIYPKRTAAITGAPAVNEVIDTTLDFNLNDVIVDGQAKIVFKTGDLAENEFEILSYDHSTKKIKFDFNKEDNGYQLPNATVKAKVGDTYTLVGIEMPQSYITTNEADLKAATIEFAEAHKHPLAAFDLSIDEKYIRDNNLVGAIGLGDRIRTIDTDMGVDKALRVQAISYPLSNPAKITATISDKVSYTITEKVIKELNSQKYEVKVVAKSIDQTSRDNAIRRREFQNKVFDPTDGYFDGGNLRPKTVEAVHLAVGTRPQDFSLNLIFKPNYQGNVNRVQWTSGKLVHNTISDSGVRSWSIASGDVTGLIDANVYYIYAKCSKVGLDGVIVLDTAERRVDDDAIYYYFLIGQLSSNINGVRWPGLSYGSTEINGRFLTTGRAQSQDGKTYMDFDSSEIGGTIKFVSTNGTFKNVTEVEAATVQANNLADQAITDAFNAATAAASAKTKADNAAAAAGTAQTAASNAQTDATNAKNLLADISSDSKLSPSEKIQAKKEWEEIKAEKPTIEAQATTYAVVTEKTAYVNAYNDLNTYLNAVSTGLLNDITTTSAIDGAVFRSKFSAYLDKKTILLKVVAEKAKTIADEAKLTADSAASAAGTAQQTANAAKGITDNFSKIEGGLMYANTLRLGTQVNTTAGITGLVVNNDSIMIWAGATFENRHNAKFRVSYDGRVWMTDANITGTINATSGTIGGFQISAGGFGLNGTKVTIEPNRGIAVSGYLAVPKSFDAVNAPTNEWVVYVDESGTAQNPTVPQGITSLASLTDTLISTPTTGQLLRYDNGQWKNWTPNFSTSWTSLTGKPTTLSGFGITDAWTKTESDGLYLGINGTAVNSTKWDGYGNALATVTPSLASNGYLLGIGAGGTWVNKFDQAGVRTFLGLGSAAYLNADQSTVANTIALRSPDGYLRASYFIASGGASGTGETTVANKIYGGYGADGVIRPMSQSSVRSFLGLGASAYTAETLQSVTDRGATTTNAITTGDITISRTGNTGGRINLGSSNRTYLFGVDTFLQVITNNVERLRVDANGNVGIGMSPDATYKLDINGHARIAGDVVTTNSFKSLGGGGYGELRALATTVNTTTLEFWSNYGNNVPVKALSLYNGSATIEGSASVKGAIVAYSYVDVNGYLYTRSNQAMLNKAQNAWLTWATRNTSGTEAVFDLGYIGSISANNISLSPSPVYSAVTDLTNATINVGERTGITTGFVPMIHQRTVLTSGYRKHVSIGTYRAGAWSGGIYFAQGGNDNNPTEYFLMTYGGKLEHSSGRVTMPALAVDNALALPSGQPANLETGKWYLYVE